MYVHHTVDSIINVYLVSSLYKMEYICIDSMLLCICPVTDHTRCQNVVKKMSDRYSCLKACVLLSLLLPHFDTICGQNLLER